MAADIPAKQEPVNPCCSAWRERCIRYKEKRDALREVVKLFEQQFDKIQTQKLNLEKAYEEERARAEVEKEGKEKESAGRVLLENEISALKSEISILQQNVGSNSQSVEEVKLLEVRLTEREKEIQRLKQALEKEKVRVNSVKKNAEAEKKNAAEVWTHVEAEKGKANEERRRANVEGKKAEEYRLQLESLRKEADNAKSKLVAEVLNSEDLSKKLEAEKQKVSKEKKRADSEMAKVEEQRKLAEANRKQAEEEKCHAENLSQQLEEARQTIVGLQKEISDFVSRYSEASVQIGELQKQIDDLQSSRKPYEASAVQPDKFLNADSEKVNLLKKQLKFEKMRVKHAKQVAELEKSRNSILHQELGCLKLDVVQFLHRLDVVDKCFSPNAVDNLGKEKDMDCSNIQSLKLKEKLRGIDPLKMHCQSENELLKPCCTDITAASLLRQPIQNIFPSPSLSGGICSESMSGTDSKLESLLGGSSRKMLQSSAINSSSASFSDRQLMGSQERGAFSVTTSSKLIEESLNAQATNSSMSGEINRARSERKLAVDAENSVRSPLRLGGTAKVNGPSRKRKRVFNVIESIALLHSEVRKLNLQMENKICDLRNILNKQVDKSLEEENHTVPNLHDTSYVKHEQFPKKRKSSQEENIGMQLLCAGGEMNKTEKVDAKGHEDARVFKQTSGPADNLIRTSQACTESIRDSVVSALETMMNFEDVANGDYMKLLDLDNPADEECYRTATEMPLSPTLPNIEFRAIETFEPLSEERFYEGLSREQEIPVPSCSYDVINVEISSNELNYNVSRNSPNSLPYDSECPLDSNDVKVNGAMEAGETCDNQIRDYGVTGEISELCRSGDEGVTCPSENELGPAPDNIPQHFVVFHNIKDENSISRILHATKTCLARCSLVLRTEWMLQKIFLALKMEDHLLSTEKACVFFSMLLLNFSTAAQEISKNSLESDIILCLDFFASHVSAAMSNAEASSAFDELCLDELLSLIEEFLMDGKVMTCTIVSSDILSEHNSEINILVDSVNTMVSTEAASAAQLVAGSIILASISAATDRIEFICEASYNIFRVHMCDLSLVLTILHIFAYLGGEKIFTSRKYNLIMMLLKSIVVSLEKGCLSVAANSSISFESQIQSNFHPCAECPFSRDAVSVEIAISLLLEKLWRFAQSGTVDPLLHKDQVAKCCQEPCCLLDINSFDASCFLNKSKMPAFQSKSVADTTLCHVTDVLSLVELLACLMRWDWTCTTVIPELLKMLESPIAESFIIAIVVLLSQLGRLGVDACGYEDKDVESLRNNLSAFLQRETTTRAGLPLQIATVTALLGLLSLDFEQVIQINVMGSSFGSQSVPVDSIRKWFSKLSKEHHALLFSLLGSSALVPKLK